MKNYTSSKTMVLLGLIAGAAVAVAQVPSVNVSVGGIGSVGAAASGGVSATSSPGASAGIGGAAGGAAAGGAYNAPDGMAGRVEAFESLGMRQERLAAENPPAASTSLETTVTPVPNERAASTVLQTGFSADTIRATTVAERAQLAKDIDTRIDTSAKAMHSLKAESKSLDGQAKADFKAAAKDVDASEKSLKASMKAARKASAETWTESRAQVAADYEAYTQSVSRAEAVVAENHGMSATTTSSATTAPAAATGSVNATAADAQK